MSRYNHFSDKRYPSVCFGSIKVGEKFRMDRRDGKRRRKDIIMLKLSELSFMEFKSKKVTNVYHNAFDVSAYEK